MHENVETLRFNMVEQQIRPWDVLDQDILDLLMRLRREDYVPEAYRGLAFVDMEIPLTADAVMWSPKLEGRAVQSLAIQPHERVLEVGTGSGFVTAMLAQLAAEVVSVEIDPALATTATETLAAQGVSNVQIRVGDAAQDWAEDGAFDAILLTDSVPVMPEALLCRLKPGGRLFAIVGDRPMMVAQCVTAIGDGLFHAEILFDTVTAPLRNAATPSRFSF